MKIHKDMTMLDAYKWALENFTSPSKINGTLIGAYVGLSEKTIMKIGVVYRHRSNKDYVKYYAIIDNADWGEACSVALENYKNSNPESEFSLD